MHQNEREERGDVSRGASGPAGADAGGKHYQLRQQMLSVGDDYWIEDDRGDQCYKVDGKALRIRQTLILEDRAGRPLFSIRERLLRIKQSMEIEDANGQQVAVVEKSLVTLLREHYAVKVKNGTDLEVHGNILDHEYRISAGANTVAEVSKKWFRVGDTYGVEIAPGQDDGLLLAVAICIDQMAHRRR